MRREPDFIEVEDTFLTDTPTGTKIEPTQFFLFCRGVYQNKRSTTRKRFVQSFRCVNTKDMLKQLRRFMRQPNIKLVERT
jgi:hypothetical protein